MENNKITDWEEVTPEINDWEEISSTKSDEKSTPSGFEDIAALERGYVEASPDILKGAALGTAKGLTLNTNDEIEARVRSLIGEQSYEKLLPQIRTRNKEIDDKSYGTSTAAELLSGYLVPGAVGAKTIEKINKLPIIAQLPGLAKLGVESLGVAATAAPLIAASNYGTSEKQGIEALKESIPSVGQLVFAPALNLGIKGIANLPAAYNATTAAGKKLIPESFTKAKTYTEQGINLDDISKLSDDAQASAKLIRESLQESYVAPTTENINKLKNEIKSITNELKGFKLNVVEKGLNSSKEINDLTGRIQSAKNIKQGFEQELTNLKGQLKGTTKELTIKERENINQQIQTLQKESDDFTKMLKDASSEEQELRKSLKLQTGAIKQQSKAVVDKLNEDLKTTEKDILKVQELENQTNLSKDENDLNINLKNLQKGVFKADKRIGDTFNEIHDQVGKAGEGGKSLNFDLEKLITKFQDELDNGTGRLAALSSEIKEAFKTPLNDYKKTVTYPELRNFMELVNGLSESADNSIMRGFAKKMYGEINKGVLYPVLEKVDEKLAEKLAQNNMMFRTSLDLKDRFLDNFDLNKAPQAVKGESEFIESSLSSTAKKMINNPNDPGDLALFKKNVGFIPETAEVLPNLESIAGSIRQRQQFKPQITSDNPEINQLRELIAKASKEAPEQVNLSKQLKASTLEDIKIKKEIDAVKNDVKTRITALKNIDPEKNVEASEEILKLKNVLEDLQSKVGINDIEVQKLTQQLNNKQQELFTQNLLDRQKELQFDENILTKQKEMQALASNPETSSEQRKAIDIYGRISSQNVDKLKNLPPEATGTLSNVDRQTADFLSALQDSPKLKSDITTLKKEFAEQTKKPELLDDAFRKSDIMSMSEIINNVTKQGPKELPAIPLTASPLFQAQLIGKGLARKAGGTTALSAKAGKFAGKITSNPETLTQKLASLALKTAGGTTRALSEPLGRILRGIAEEPNAQKRAALSFAMMQDKNHRAELENSGLMDEELKDENSGR